MSMKKSLLIAAVLILAVQSPADARKRQPDFTKSVGMTYLDGNFSTYDALQKEIHRYAEPGYLEYKSSEAIARHLESNGFTVERGVAEIPTAFVATFGSGKPVIGILGEYDALPGMSQDTCPSICPVEAGAPGHGCGHNLIGTASVAGAVAISKWLAEGHAGTIKYFGCPAEEGGGGKAYMVRAGCFDGCDCFFDWHPDTDSDVATCAGLANVRVRFTFHGVSSHASVAPWKGRSALDAVEAFNYMMNMMREHLQDFTRIHYVIDNGGLAPNVVPATASVLYYIRHPKAEVVLETLERAVAAANGAAMGTGTTMTYEVMNGNYERLKNNTMANVMLKNLIKVGGLRFDDREKAFLEEIMRNSNLEPDLSNFENVVTEIYDGFSGASSDVGNVSQMGPIASMDYASLVKGVALHTWQLTAIGGTTIGTKILINVAKVFYLTALDIYTSPETVKAAWDEYYSYRGHDFKFVPLMGDRKPPLDYNVKK